ncbi:MAG: TIM barrel protein [Oscillospiraceae bacterium]|nr:TIM barrel protein [Oscillospiraceae bacterium]
MKESIHKYFKVSTILPMSYPAGPVLNTLRRIACDDYFDAVEVTSFSDDTARDEAIAMLREGNLCVGFSAQPCLMGAGLNVNSLDETKRQAAEARLLRAVDEARQLGAERLAFLSGKWEKATQAQAYAQLLKTTRAVCAHAADKGITVELEVFDYDVDKASLIGPAPYAAQFAADMRKTDKNFGLLVDLSHFPLTRETSEQVITACRPYITHLHLGNAVIQPGCEAYGDMHPRFGFPNSANGCAELVDFLRVLKREGFFRPEDPYMLSFEVKPWKAEDADVVLAGTKRILNRAWALLED